MTTTLAWPDSLPLPSLKNYAVKPKTNLDRTDMEVGQARQRRRSTATLDQVPVQFELTAWEEMIFDAWIDLRANAGATWFTMPLLSGRGLETWEVRILGGTDRENRPRNGARWICTLTLEVRDRPKLTGAELDLLIDEDGAALLRSIDVIHYHLRTVLGGP